MNVAIVTDSNSGIFTEEGKTYYEGVNLTHEEFCHVGHGAFGMGISKRIR